MGRGPGLLRGMDRRTRAHRAHEEPDRRQDSRDRSGQRPLGTAHGPSAKRRSRGPDPRVRSARWTRSHRPRSAGPQAEQRGGLAPSERRRLRESRPEQRLSKRIEKRMHGDEPVFGPGLPRPPEYRIDPGGQVGPKGFGGRSVAVLDAREHGAGLVGRQSRTGPIHAQRPAVGVDEPGPMEGQRLEEHRGQSELIRRPGGRFGTKLLGRQIRRGADHPPIREPAWAPMQARRPEIHDHQSTGRPDDVGRLQVTVNDARRVGMAQAPHQIGRPLGDAGPGERSILLGRPQEERGQRHPVDPLHDQVRTVSSGSVRDPPGQVGVPQAPQDVALPHEALSGLPLRPAGGLEELDRYRSPGLWVEGAPHRAVASFSGQGEEAMAVVEDGTWSQRIMHRRADFARTMPTASARIGVRSVVRSVRSVRFVRISVLAAVLLLAAEEASAQSIQARFPSLWATRGRDLQVSVDVDDASGAVQEARYTLTVDGLRTLTATASRDSGFVATFPAAEVWSDEAERLELSAELLGRRGGLILSLGEPFPLPLDILTPIEAEQRLADLTPEAPEPFQPTPIGAAVGIGGQLGTSARLRAHIRFSYTAGAWEPGAVAIVGPNFDGDAGDLTFGAELDLRRYAPLDVAVIPYAAFRIGIDARFPGIDPLIGPSVGVQIPLGDVAFEVQLDGSVLYFDGFDGGREVGFAGGLRTGIRFTGRAAL